MNRRITLLSVLVLLALACSLTTPSTREPAGSPVRPSEASGMLRIVYVDNGDGFRGGNVWIIEGDAAPRQLTFSGQDVSPQISDDGQRVAFHRILDPALGLQELWVINSDGTSERVLISQAWLAAVKPGDTVSVLNTEWVPGEHEIAFNTHAVADAPGFDPHENLYTVNVEDGGITTLLPPESNAVLFYYSPAGDQIALTSYSTISLINADGSNRRDPVSYQAVARGEGAYIIRVDWAPDGTYLRTLIPPNDPDPLAATDDALWHIPADGAPAYSMGIVAGTNPFVSSNLRLFSPDLAHVAYMRASGDPAENLEELHLSSADGLSAQVYISGPRIQWWGWASDSRRFIYSTGDADWLGEIGAAPRALFTDPTKVYWPRWTNDGQVIFFSGENDVWQLRIGTPGGASRLLAAPATDLPEFDFSQ